MEKGNYGYINAYKKRYGTISLVLLIIIAAMLAGVYIAFGSFKHFAVIAPIILTLPFAKVGILWIIVAKYRSLKKADKEKLEAAFSGRDDISVQFDMALSSYESVSFAPVILMDSQKIYLLWGGATSGQYTKEDQNEYVSGIVAKTGYKFPVVTVTTIDELIEQVNRDEVIAVENQSVENKLEEQDNYLDEEKQRRLAKRFLDVCV